MSEVPATIPTVPIAAENVEAILKIALDELAREIGRDAVEHLKQMYPDALKVVTKNAEVSLTNHIRNNINYRMKPVLAVLGELSRRRGV